MPMLSHVKFHKLQKISRASLNTIAAFSLTTESVDDQLLDVVCHLFHHLKNLLLLSFEFHDNESSSVNIRRDVKSLLNDHRWPWVISCSEITRVSELIRLKSLC